MKEKAYGYIATVLILSYAWQLLVYMTGGPGSKFLNYLMYFPAIIAFAFIIISKKGFWEIGWGIRKWYYIIPAIFIPMSISFLAVYLIQLLSWGNLASEHFTFPAGIFESSGIDIIVKRAPESTPIFSYQAIIPLLLLLLYGTIAGLGEEIGWRGYLQEKLIKKHGLYKGLLLLGIVWSYWHLPVYLMGLSFPGHPILGALVLAPLHITLLGIFLGWLYIRSGTIWAPVIGHISANLFTAISYPLLIMNTNELSRYFLIIAMWAIIAILCFIDLKRKQKHPPSFF